MSPERIVGVDIRLWSHPGIGRYERELVTAMLEEKRGIAFSFLGYARDLDGLCVRYPGIRRVEAKTAVFTFAEQGELSAFSRTVDLLHSPNFNVCWNAACPWVATVHDLIYLKARRYSGSWLKMLYAKQMFGRIESKAKAVIAVSDFTREDLARSFPRSRPKIRVIPEACASFFRPPEAETLEIWKGQAGRSRPYFLYVGSLKAHKNLSRLLDAFETLRGDRRFEGHELVLSGRMDNKEKGLVTRIRSMGDRGVRYLGEISDRELPSLYAGAVATVVPSLWEGFGLTLLEAMACGSAAIASNRSSLPEVGGPAPIYFDPTDTEALRRAMESVGTDGSLRQRLVARGLEQASVFSWKKAARETLDLYERCLV